MLLSSRFRDALVFAAQLHAAQCRKVSGVPYVAHLLDVASLVIKVGGSEDEVIAALLHDAIEDQGGASARERIRLLFGDAVVAIVDGCTNAEADPKPPWRERKTAHLAHIRSASSSIRLVTSADKLANVRDLLRDYRVLGEAVWERFDGRREGSLWYFRAMLDSLRGAPSNPLVTELEAVVTELEQLASRKASPR